MKVVFVAVLAIAVPEVEACYRPFAQGCPSLGQEADQAVRVDQAHHLAVVAASSSAEARLVVRPEERHHSSSVAGALDQVAEGSCSAC